MSWSTADIPDQSGRVAVVTGANSGLGLASAKALAGAGAHVVMAARDQAKAETARTDILATHPDASLEVIELDLADQSSVERAARTIDATHDRVDVLMLNAGIMAMPEGTTADGFETQWGVNVLGHWTLTALLLPTLVATPGARVVSVSSSAQHMTRGIAEDPHLRGAGEYDPWRAYAQSKLANRLLAVGLQERFERAGVDAMAFAVHPGLTNSDLQQRTAREGGGGRWMSTFADLMPTLGMDVDRGALSQLRAATDPAADPHRMYCPLFTNVGPPVGKPMVRPGLDEEVDALWRLAERDTGHTLDVVAAAS